MIKIESGSLDGTREANSVFLSLGTLDSLRSNESRGAQFRSPRSERRRLQVEVTGMTIS
uniref:Uncharacterized protein n=1 Tax=viral metagenome TaxID=1070528 RepID=A0A6C0IYV9_9ZZZZ